MALYVQESFVNATEGYRFGDSPVYESYCETSGEVFRHGQREYGRCVSRIYIDTDDGIKAVGWVFQRTERYEDTRGPYVREVWVTVHDAPETVTRVHHYHFID